MWYNIVMLWGNTPHLQALAVPADNIVIPYDDNKRIRHEHIRCNKCGVGYYHINLKCCGVVMRIMSCAIHVCLLVALMFSAAIVSHHIGYRYHQLNAPQKDNQ